MQTDSDKLDKPKPVDTSDNQPFTITITRRGGDGTTPGNLEEDSQEEVPEPRDLHSSSLSNLAGSPTARGISKGGEKGLHGRPKAVSGLVVSSDNALGSAETSPTTSPRSGKLGEAPTPGKAASSGKSSSAGTSAGNSEMSSPKSSEKSSEKAATTTGSDKSAVGKKDKTRTPDSEGGKRRISTVTPGEEQGASKKSRTADGSEKREYSSAVGTIPVKVTLCSEPFDPDLDTSNKSIKKSYPFKAVSSSFHGLSGWRLLAEEEVTAITEVMPRLKGEAKLVMASAAKSAGASVAAWWKKGLTEDAGNPHVARTCGLLRRLVISYLVQGTVASYAETFLDSIGGADEALDKAKEEATRWKGLQMINGTFKLFLVAVKAGDKEGGEVQEYAERMGYAALEHIFIRQLGESATEYETRKEVQRLASPEKETPGKDGTDKKGIGAAGKPAPRKIPLKAGGKSGKGQAQGQPMEDEAEEAGDEMRDSDDELVITGSNIRNPGKGGSSKTGSTKSQPGQAAEEPKAPEPSPVVAKPAEPSPVAHKPAVLSPAVTKPAEIHSQAAGGPGKGGNAQPMAGVMPGGGEVPFPPGLGMQGYPQYGYPYAYQYGFPYAYPPWMGGSTGGGAAPFAPGMGGPSSSPPSAAPAPSSSLTLASSSSAGVPAPDFTDFDGAVEAQESAEKELKEAEDMASKAEIALAEAERKTRELRQAVAEKQRRLVKASEKGDDPSQLLSFNILSAERGGTATLARKRTRETDVSLDTPKRRNGGRVDGQGGLTLTPSTLQPDRDRDVRPVTRGSERLATPDKAETVRKGGDGMSVLGADIVPENSPPESSEILSGGSPAKEREGPGGSPEKPGPLDLLGTVLEKLLGKKEENHPRVRLPTDFVELPPRFSPDKVKDVDGWIRSFKAAVKFYKLPETEWADALAHRVAEQYKAECLTHTGEAWAVTEAWFLDRFKPPGEEEALAQEVDEIRQHENEPIKTYLERFNVLWCRHAGIRAQQGGILDEISKITQCKKGMKKSMRLSGLRELQGVRTWAEFTKACAKVEHEMAEGGRLLGAMTGKEKKEMEKAAVPAFYAGGWAGRKAGNSSSVDIKSVVREVARGLREEMGGTRPAAAGAGGGHSQRSPAGAATPSAGQGGSGSVKSQPTESGQPLPRDVCGYCNKTGHWRRDCPERAEMRRKRDDKAARRGGGHGGAPGGRSQGTPYRGRGRGYGPFYPGRGRGGQVRGSRGRGRDRRGGYRHHADSFYLYPEDDVSCVELGTDSQEEALREEQARDLAGFDSEADRTS